MESYDPILLPDASSSTLSPSKRWAQILALEKLSTTSEARKTEIKVQGQSTVNLGNVSLKTTSSGLADIVFSSYGDYEYFGSSYPTSLGDKKWNAAWQGDDQGSALLLLEPPKSSDLDLKTVLAALNIDLPNAGKKINSFISALGLDQKPVPVKLSAQPTLFSNGRPASALWFAQDSNFKYKVTRCMTFELDTAVGDQITTWLNSQTELDVSFASDMLKSIGLRLTVAANATYAAKAGSPRESVSTTFTVEFDMGDYAITVSILASSATILVTPRLDLTKSLSLLDMVKHGLKGLKDQPTSDLPDTSDKSDPIVAFVGNKIYPWYLHVGQIRIGSRLLFDLGVGAFLILGKAKPVVIALAYELSSGTFSGRLITAMDLLDPTFLRAPTYDPRYCPVNMIKTVDSSALLNAGINLWDIITNDGGGKTSAPKHLPLWLTEFSVQITKTSDSGSKSSDFTFSAAMTRDPSQPTVSMADASEVPTGLSWTDVTIHAGVTTVATTQGGSSTSSSQYVLGITSEFVLKPDPKIKVGEATARIALAYDSGAEKQSSWLLTAQVKDLSAGLLASFFDTEVQAGAMSVLKNLTLRQLNIAYAHTAGQASSFYIYGMLQLGELELDLSYQYVSTLVKAGQETAYDLVSGSANKDDSIIRPGDYVPEKPPKEVVKAGLTEKKWIFQAQLRATSAASTVGSVLESIVPGSNDALPAFVSDIQFNPVGASGVPMADVTFEHNAKGSTLCVFVNIAGFSFSSVHYYALPSADGKTKASTKRILRFSCDKIPMMDRVPLINQLPQPFDSLQYLWVTDDQEAVAKQGVTKGDVEHLASLQTPIPPMQYKQTKKDGEKTDDVVIAVGHHFMVVAGGKVVLDHVFGNAAATVPKKTPSPTPLRTLAVSAVVVGAAGTDTGDQAAAKPTKGNVKIKAGPLSITAIGLQMVAGHLQVTLDATLDLGAISMSVIGFTIDIDLSHVKLNDLRSLTAEAVGDALQTLSISLRGLEVGLERGPLTLVGALEHGHDTSEYYRGGIAVGFKAWQILAIGEYRIVQPKPNAEGFRAVFVFGKLDGPLVELEFATISGVRLGFAYNYMVRMPTVDELYRFPFISDGASDVGASGNDPMKVLKAMTEGDNPFVSVKEGSIWMCAGMTITAFDVLTLTAVLMLQITTKPDAGNTAAGSDGVVIALFADGIFQMEPLVSPDASLFYVELVVKVEFNFIQGYIAADAALAPTSHVFVPAARLTGTASFYSWFGNNPHSGDWVVSVGGYARNYRPPAHYPSNERIQLSFTVGDNIQIIGNGYVAVTPRCAMAGGSLHLSLRVGPVFAYADVIMDAFLNFKPFHFRAVVTLSVGVECRIDILFIHTSVSVHLGAELTLWGPDEFGGHAHVNFWFFGFSIAFGTAEKNNMSDPVELQKFLEMLKSPGPNGPARQTDEIVNNPNSKDLAVHKWTVEQGMVAKQTPAAPDGGFPSTGVGYEWDVDAASLVLRVDVNFALTAIHWTTKVDGDLRSKENTIPAGGNISSEVTAVYAMPMHSQSAAESDITITLLKDHEVQVGWQVEAVMKKSAPALWSHTAWTADNDPLSQGGNPPDAMRNGSLPSGIDLVMGVRVLPPDPHSALSKIIMFDMTLANTDIVQAPKEKPIPVEAAETTFGASMFEPEKMSKAARWDDFAVIMNSKENSVGFNLNDMRRAIAAEVGIALEWDIRPVGASVDDPDAHEGWKLKVADPGNLAEEARNQWIELPFVSIQS